MSYGWQRHYQPNALLPNARLQQCLHCCWSRIVEADTSFEVSPMRRPNDTCPAPEANSIPNATRRPHSITYAIRNRRHMGAPARGQTAIQGHHGIWFGISTSGALYRCFIEVPILLPWRSPLIIMGRTYLNEAHCSTKLMVSRSRKHQRLSSISFCRTMPPAGPSRIELKALGQGAPPAWSVRPNPNCG